MDAAPVDVHLEAGWHALEGAQWDAAREAFEAVPSAGESPDALDGLGLAVWFLGDVNEGIATRERAFEAYVRDGRP